MPDIRPSSALRNDYPEISAYCHESRKPVFITKNGVGDLAVMSIEQYDELMRNAELYQKLAEGLIAAQSEKGRPAAEVIASLREEVERGDEL